jgi:bacterioferritin-associated ferredoxin
LISNKKTDIKTEQTHDKDKKEAEFLRKSVGVPSCCGKCILKLQKYKNHCSEVGKRQ